MSEQPDHATLRKSRPLLRGILPLTLRQLPREILAGATLAALAIPEVMGYAKIAGMPVVTGIYTLFIPMLAYALLSSSRHLVVGADSATAAILAAGLTGLAAPQTDHYIALAGLTALLAAALLLLARWVRLGFLANFLSRTVLIGFLTGVGIQVALGQLPAMFGLEPTGYNGWENIWQYVKQLESPNYYALGISLSALLLIASCKKCSPHIPAALIAVVAATLTTWAMDLDTQLPVLGTLPAGLPELSLPKVDWHPQLIVDLAPTAFAIFIVILAQSAATARAYATRYGERFDENADLSALCVANLGAALSSSFVVNGSPTKTQIVNSAGGRTQLSMVVTSMITLMVLLFMTQTLHHMPDAVLAAVVFVIGLELVDLRGMRAIYAARRSEFWVAVATAGTVILVGVEQGIMLALALSLVVHTRHGYKPRNALLRPSASGGWQASPVSSGTQAAPGLIIYRFTHSIYYANAQLLTDEVTHLATSADPPLHYFCIEISAVDDIDFTAAETLRELHKYLSRRGIRLVFAAVMSGTSANAPAQIRALFDDKALYKNLEAVVADAKKAEGRSAHSE
ncbi:SulP family inorganic anion transporter [Microbulbifer thermotolerans]|uniref:SulP family inorganic anion transporter n=1 Tax=Microbulbifer thermotolerans TaxID=252514 RepID=A0AB35I1Z5_MICTH|nr:SulP family inorganic anion transporter [Microbulbifer thermotolerans]MCX2802742.1 SulP family inorganic anion transporter [Microbulbifer thermotolerans]